MFVQLNIFLFKCVSFVMASSVIQTTFYIRIRIGMYACIFIFTLKNNEINYNAKNAKLTVYVFKHFFFTFLWKRENLVYSLK
jgi:hypothetical protein